MTQSTCSALFRASGQPLAGTATRAKGYLFLPVPMPLWGKDAINTRWAKQETIEHVERLSVNNVRVRLYAPTRQHNEPFYFGDPAHRSEAGSLAGRAGFRAVNVSPENLAFVCCHGKRDRCCAYWGNRLHNEISAGAPTIPFLKCSHLGGDRFAPTVIFFPSGNMYGALSGADVAHVGEREQSGHFSAEKYRGRVFDDREMQLARYAVAINKGDFASESAIQIVHRSTSNERLLVTVDHWGERVTYEFTAREAILASDCTSLHRGVLKRYSTFAYARVVAA